MALPLLHDLPRLWWLHTCWDAQCAAHTRVTVRDDAGLVASVLADQQGRLTCFGGREGCARSVASVYTGAITRFLGGSLASFGARTKTFITEPGFDATDITFSASGEHVYVYNDECNEEFGVDLWQLNWRSGSKSWYSPPNSLMDNIFDVACSADGVTFLLIQGQRSHIYSEEYAIASFHPKRAQMWQVFAAHSDATNIVVTPDSVIASCNEMLVAYSRVTGKEVQRATGDQPFGKLCLFAAGQQFAVAAGLAVEVRAVHDDCYRVVRVVGRNILRDHGRYYSRKIACSAFDELAVCDFDRVVLFSALGTAATVIFVAAQAVAVHPLEGLVCLLKQSEEDDGDICKVIL
jgi:hypothetical protein